MPHFCPTIITMHALSALDMSTFQGVDKCTYLFALIIPSRGQTGRKGRREKEPFFPVFFLHC